MDEDKQDVELCKIKLKVDEHISEIKKDEFRGIENIDQDMEMTVKRV